MHVSGGLASTQLAPVPYSIPYVESCSWLQTIFGLCSEALPTPPVTSPAAPRTSAELAPGGWTVDDLFTQTVLETQKANQIYQQALTLTPSVALDACPWYQSYNAASAKCGFGSLTLFLVAGGGLAAILLLRRS